jgi:YD repeat-containing protein
MGRVVRKINTDGIDQTTLNDSDVLISYEGCGCAGGLVTTIEGELVPRTDTTGNARRKQKVYQDILGRTTKTEMFEWNGSTVYSTVVNTFNGRDQVTQSRQYAGSNLSSTYQDTTATFDGHGRLASSHKPEQRDSSDNLKYTTYNYNPDGSISSSTDGRGVITNLTYNSRGLLTNKGWDVGSTGVADPTDVTFGYDNIGNRTQMTDGLGTVAYSYNSLSQMTDETRDFTDTLADARTACSSLSTHTRSEASLSQ